MVRLHLFSILLFQTSQLTFFSKSTCRWSLGYSQICWLGYQNEGISSSLCCGLLVSITISDVSSFQCNNLNVSKIQLNDRVSVFFYAQVMKNMLTVLTEGFMMQLVLTFAHRMTTSLQVVHVDVLRFANLTCFVESGGFQGKSVVLSVW